MAITKKEKYLVETFCDRCKKSLGTSLIDPDEFGDWLKRTIDLLTFLVSGKPLTLCWECIKELGLAREYNKRVNDLTFGPQEGGDEKS